MDTIGSRYSGRVVALIAAILLSFVVLPGVSACGQRGPLYLPDSDPPGGTEPADAETGSASDQYDGQSALDEKEHDEETS